MDRQTRDVVMWQRMSCDGAGGEGHDGEGDGGMGFVSDDLLVDRQLGDDADQESYHSLVSNTYFNNSNKYFFYNFKPYLYHS